MAQSESYEIDAVRSLAAIRFEGKGGLSKVLKNLVQLRRLIRLDCRQRSLGEKRSSNR
jgi:hypothetical protein